MILRSRVEFLNESSFDDLFGAVHEGGYSCFNRGLKSLVDLDIPDTVTGYFYCSSNELTSLTGAPICVGEDFNCSFNLKLSSLKGHPKEVKGNFYLMHCPLITAEMIEDLKKNCKIGGKIITK